MTEREKRAWIIAGLRRLSCKWPAKNEAKKLARVGWNQYRCARCCQIFGNREIQLDHVAPVGSFVSFDVLCARLFCEVANYQVLCKPCHLEKSADDRAA